MQSKKEYNLDTNLSYNMPKGYENAFGTFDIILDTLFLNLNKEFSKIRVLYFLSWVKTLFAISFF